MSEMNATPDVAAIRNKLLAKMADRAEDYPLHIELRFPHILARIADLWGTAELDAYLDVLMLPDRQDRQGFPPEVAMDVFHLSTVHGTLGLAPKVTHTGWAGVEDAELEKKSIVKSG